MKAFVITVGVILLLSIIISAIVHNHAIRHGRCPRCGSPIVPFANGRQSGYRCTECEWWEITDGF